MFNLTWLDYSYVVVLLASTVWATIRGGIYETVATLSWVVAAVTARFVSPMLDTLFQKWFGLTESTVGTLVASYFIVFFVILLIGGIPELSLIILLICILAAISDEVGHEMISSLTQNRFMNLFFEYRFVMKIVLLLLALCGALNIWIFVCFMLFEISYVCGGLVFENFN